MSSLCWECKYEHSDCKGDKWVEKVACPYFSKKLAINYPKVIEELERKVEFFESLYQGQLDANERLLLRKETLEAQNEELKAKLKQTDEAYDSQGDQLLEALDEIEKLKEENHKMELEIIHSKSVIKDLHREKEELKAEIEGRVECGADCDKCEVKCRAWQNGYNATCERECDNCEVIADMQSLKNVLSKLIFDYADNLRGDAE